ncbi:MAG: DUF98 domain-containing protein [Candidatus Lokiarchaeota archaeon]|nr:DUF98 domain-containing protein [Candidatus Lokiarchaeota archaeon]
MEHISKVTNNLLKIVELGDKSLDWDAINQRIKEMCEILDISDALKLILTSTGSVTKALEVLSGNNVMIKTIFQKIAPIASEHQRLINALNLKPKDKLNFREVWLTDNNRNYVFALSLTPIKRLDPLFEEDLIKADVPIGRLLDKYNLECRREIFTISSMQYKHLMKIGIDWNDHLKQDQAVPYRVYNIIKQNQVIMVILEFFHPNI